MLNLPGVQCFKTLGSSKCACLFQNNVISASACTAQLTFNNPLILDQKYRTRENFKGLGKKNVIFLRVPVTTPAIIHVLPSSG